METHAEQQLAGRLQRGDETALSDLDQTYRHKIYQLALSYMKNHWDAEEVTQDVLFRVFRKIDTFRGDAALSSWIYRITFNTAMSRLRSARFGRPFEIPESSLVTIDDDGMPKHKKEAADRSPLADDEVYRAQLRRRLAAVLAKMPSIYSVPIVLRDIQGLSTCEASAVLHVKPETFKSRLHRGRITLRARMGDYADGMSLHGSTA